ncbi:hypothetical protein ppKF707_1682 [Metapseudomonas furukawaii]|uniref:Uncharacterized protein n=1 Tax=Metapseudomonas furukawaii TaxID=1149133 RepID=A0AAD1C0P8_METFU|nr:hypothetical protein ppKF707_1682 [Pseudomonas furukawaii]BAU75181.1 hypothetical protein KF707C_34930 [Pseudomonas furukawaii]
MRMGHCWTSLERHFSLSFISLGVTPDYGHARKNAPNRRIPLHRRSSRMQALYQ